MTESYRIKGLRKKLVATVKSKGIHDERILKAIGKIPRHRFLDSSFLEFAYQDKPFPIGSGQTISQPYTVAFQTQLLKVEEGDKVLEIGTGSGYQACVLLELGAKVYSIERQKQLFEKASEFLPTIGYYPKLFYSDGYKGLKAFAPYHRILITAGAPYIPAELLEQLRIGGRLVAPVGKGDVQTMKAIDKLDISEYKETDHGTFRFVPLLNNKADDI